MTIVGFTGSQLGLQLTQQHSLMSIMRDYSFTEVHHGDCVGSDDQFHVLAATRGLDIWIHPPIKVDKRAWCSDRINSKLLVILEPKEYLARDDDIVRSSDFLIACPRGFREENRSGTWYTIRSARRLGHEGVIIWPDGHTTNLRY